MVREVGDEVALLSPGDEVIYAGDIIRPGTNAELQLVDERIVGCKPSSLSFANAAGIPLTSITAWEIGVAPDRYQHAVEAHGIAGGHTPGVPITVGDAYSGVDVRRMADGEAHFAFEDRLAEVVKEVHRAATGVPGLAAHVVAVVVSDGLRVVLGRRNKRTALGLQ